MIKGLFMMLFAFILLRCNHPGETFKDGKNIYLNLCSGCHGNALEGFAKLYPPLNNSNRIKIIRKALPCLIKKGINSNNDSSDTIGITMPAFSQLDEIDLSNLLNYLNSNFWKLDKFELNEIKIQLSNCSVH